jgi:hypothetical protein
MFCTSVILVPVVSDVFVNGRPVTPRDQLADRAKMTARAIAQITQPPTPPPEITQPPTPPPKITIPLAPDPSILTPDPSFKERLTPDPSIKERRDPWQQIKDHAAASSAYVGCLYRSAKRLEPERAKRLERERSLDAWQFRREVDDDGEADAIVQAMMSSCAFEFWAYVVARSRILDDRRAHSLLLDDELARRQEVAKALREQGYRAAILMVQQIRNPRSAN